MFQPEWQLVKKNQVPQWLIEAVKPYTPASQGIYAAQLLWQRGIKKPEILPGFLNPDEYQPTSCFAFGQEIKWAINRLQKAWETGEKVAIWGDFDADGITATSVLYSGLGQFLNPEKNLSYYIPNRLTESHGLNCPGIEQLAAGGTKLIVTCDTGSTNLTEIESAKKLGIDIIITDHHTLLEERPEVVAILNPRYFGENHPLFHLSGVAVAYKLIEALYTTFPTIPQQPLAELLDLVAIGLIADLVELKGDCRYLAQKGIEQLQKTNRPGVKFLLDLCQKNGDRPTDISFGIGPRINAVSRIQGDASFCVELLTSNDVPRCKQLAGETELANTRRKSLQQSVTEEVKKKLTQIDLSTTSVIVLEDTQWETGVLGLVAGQIAQEYGRPTILLSTGEYPPQPPLIRGEVISNLARGSARSVNNIDLYELVRSQAHLLHRFGGHPYAAGLSLPRENISLFQAAINQQLRQRIKGNVIFNPPIITADLTVTVSELGESLFRELKLIEPCGMGNPAPKLLITNCTFENIWHKNIQDFRGNKIKYIRTTFNIVDDSVSEGFPGIWWGHYQEELPANQECDAMVELDFNNREKRYEVRLIAVKTRGETEELKEDNFSQEWVIDWRGNELKEAETNMILLAKCPADWEEMQQKSRQAIASKCKLALVYPPPTQKAPVEVWKELVGIAKYLSRTGKIVTREQLKNKLGISDRTLDFGKIALVSLGVNWEDNDGYVKLNWKANLADKRDVGFLKFIEAVAEEQFKHEYFYQVPVSTMQRILEERLN
ncbi:MAG: single-stranded-DNA-specific exonuclease RecJ [Gomphosphaeria aponina SAG 52.96 = DSM 107014]|uniref:Single-stranded-DNA-specific exonuclease RecJ n=1 Tax=Gomphosphaeria aponina SAG 52.96 = DSM 107014 TaxID=1521640 RepID=A0A941GSH1_9CHRO|nr:single-stranded-DNA-specific exonuclease RecJ [Gomphosphaeria aponina SAG 52.96 = DSM 107014]